MGTVADFHSHILPELDDGSASVQESIAMLRMEAEQGIRQVIATPHFYANHDSPERFLHRRAEAERRLREEMSYHDDLPEVSVGAEVYFFPGISHSEVLSQLTIGGKKGILIEMPQAPWTEAMYRELEAVHERQGLIPVIAHVDRYIRPFHTQGIPRRLASLPVLVQANASFFLRTSTRKMALKMLCADQIHLLGSDCHNLQDRVPNLGEAMEWIRKKAGSEMLDSLSQYQQSVLL